MAGKTGVRRHSHIFHSSNHPLSITTKAVAAVGLPLVIKVDIMASKVNIIKVDIIRVDIISVNINKVHINKVDINIIGVDINKVDINIIRVGLTTMQPQALRSRMVTFPTNIRLTMIIAGETIGIVF